MEGATGSIVSWGKGKLVIVQDKEVVAVAKSMSSATLK